MCLVAGGSYGLVICNKWPQEPVFLDRFNVNAVIINNNAEVTCKFFYKNTTSEIIETEFIFPLESTAAVYHLEAAIGNKKLVARCRERVEVINNMNFLVNNFEAESTYKEAVETGHTAFMMQEDFHMGDTFRMKLGNILAGDKIDITFKYVLPLYLREVDTSLDRFKTLKEPCIVVFSMPGKIGARYGKLTSQTLTLACRLPFIILNLLFFLSLH